MKKLLNTLALTLLFALSLMGAALADVAPGPIYAIVYGIPLAIVAVAVIVIVLIVKGVRKKKAAQTIEKQAAEPAPAEKEDGEEK